MKKLYTFILAAFLGTTVFASGGPDAYGYTWTTSLDVGGPAVSWIDITSRAGVQSVSGLADDNSAPGMINLGFNFHYYWNDVNQMKVGSNGWLSFNNVSNIASCFPTIPTAGGVADNYLAPLMGDLNFTGAGNPGMVKYWTNNVDTFIISYINVPFWSVNAPGYVGSNSFQVILCGGDSSITYQYGALSGFVANAACIDLTVGIENSTGSVGLQVHSDAMPPSSYAIKFDYPPVVLLSIQDALPAYNMNTGDQAEMVINTLPVSLNSDIRNAGNTAFSSPINLTGDVINAASTTVYTNSGSLPTLAAGDDSLFSYGQWTPTVAGQYSFRSSLSSAQDINSANNVKTTEIDVIDVCASTTTLSYVTGNAPSNSINWNGGANDDGAAVYFAPPVYPYTVNSLQYYITSNVSDYFIAQVYDDDGPNGGPGTLLFNTTVPSASVLSAAWNTVAVTGVTLNSGGFYVVWLQGGTTIFLGSETTAPLSHRNYEILDGAWASLRYDDAQDLCIRATIGGYTSTPTASFTAASAVLNANFTDNSTGLVTSWSWDFGDATTSTQQNPSHTYAAPGTYTVCLTATSPCGNNQTCQTITVCNLPTANYSTSTNFLDATFTDMSTGTVDTWTWDFGDASTSTQQSPVHTYATGGTYNVCLIASNACGNADTICQTVTVCPALTSTFTATQSEDSVIVTDASTGNVVSWSWDFGDSQTSNLQNDVHHYANGGTYTVCLTATDACGNTDVSCQTITIIITDVNTGTANTMTIYPNPSSSSFGIMFTNEMNATLQLTDLAGQEVMNSKVNGMKATIDVSTLPVGVYLLKVESADGTSVHKIIVQH